MSRRIGNTVIIESEPEMICFLCGKVAETRPYGPEGAEICYDCGRKDPLTTETQIGIRLFRETKEVAKKRAQEIIAARIKR